MDPIRFAIENPVKVSVGVILIVLFGFVALVTIPVQLTPDVDQPIITVETEWTGRSPEEVEREILEEQEDVLKDISGLKKMTATAFLGRGQIELEFYIGTDKDAARQEVSDSLREVPEYPDEVDEPVIQAGEAGAESPIAWLILTAETREAERFNVQALGDAAEDRIKPYLERVPGVSEVRVYGGREREVIIDLDPRAIAQRGVTFNELRQALRLHNVNVSGGEIAEGKYDVRVRTIGQYDQLDQIRRTIVKYDDGGPIRIDDLGDVRLGLEKRRSFVRSRAEVALALPVYRETGANVISIMEGTRTAKGLKDRLEDVNRLVLPQIARQIAEEEQLAEPPRLELRQVYDETVYIYDALSLVRSNLFIGGALAATALLLFLRSFRPTFIVALAIPISVIGTFVVMTAFGRNINVISLAGLAFAVGMVVDNAIVVLENIDRHIHMNKKPMRAAYDATREVWGAILASTLTTLAVFIPVLTIEEEAGQLFRDIALAICAAVTLSLLVSITVISSSSSRLLRMRSGEDGPLLRAGHNLFGVLPLFSFFVKAFSGGIHRLTAPTRFGVAARLGIVAAFTVVALGGAYLLMPPTDYLPRGNKNLVFGVVLTPPGYNIGHDESIGQRVESRIRPYWEASDDADLAELDPPVHPFTGQPIERIPPVENYFFVSFFGGVFNGATSQDKNNVAPLADLLSWATNQIPGVIGFAQQTSLFGRGLSGTRGIDVEVTGDDLDLVRSSADALYGRLRELYGFDKVQPTPGNFNLAAPELRVQIDRVRAADLGIDTDALGNGVAALVDGIVAGDYRYRGKAIDIRAQRDPAIELTPEQLAQMPLAYTDETGRRGTIPLNAVATIQRADSPQQIQRIEERRAVTLTVTPPDDEPLEAATARIDGLVGDLRDQGQIPPEIDIRLAGSASKLAQMREALLGEWHGFTLDTLRSVLFSRIFLALLVTYLLMAALFESFLYPFVIMFSVPLATVGGFLGLRLIHDGWGMADWPVVGQTLYGWLGPTGFGLVNPAQQLDVLTMLGFVILIGIVVNNAILLVHQALNFMRGLGEGEGDATGALPPREAVRASVRTRIRPIFMTTATSVAGMLPLVVMPGSGSELYKGLGSVVVGGLIVSTLFTLIVVPLLFSLVMDAKAALYAALQWSLPETEAGAPGERLPQPMPAK